METKIFTSFIACLLTISTTAVSNPSWAGNVPVNQNLSQTIKMKAASLPQAQDYPHKKAELRKKINAAIIHINQDLQNAQQRLAAIKNSSYLKGETKKAEADFKKASALASNLKNLIETYPEGGDIKAAQETVDTLLSFKKSDYMSQVVKRVNTYITQFKATFTAYVKAMNFYLTRCKGLLFDATVALSDNQLTSVENAFNYATAEAQKLGNLAQPSLSEAEQTLADAMAKADKLIKGWVVESSIKVLSTLKYIYDIKNLSDGQILVSAQGYDDSIFAGIIDPNTGKIVKKICSLNDQYYLADHTPTAVSFDGRFIAVLVVPRAYTVDRAEKGSVAEVALKS